MFLIMVPEHSRNKVRILLPSKTTAAILIMYAIWLHSVYHSNPFFAIYLLPVNVTGDFLL